MNVPERRLAKRIRVNLPVTFQNLGANKAFGETVTKDISTTGLRMNINAFFPSNSSFLVKLHFPEVNKIIEGIAQIVWSQRISFTDQYQAGLRFTEINPIFKRWLDEYIVINEALAR